ncbi:hypothetical protein EGR_00668 [Echinococcus granulosus]|uniref:Uncharacterized protein n=1 Tax=Echinococcus granulosus TaxID=6210 RepID=W6UTV1_ECHGR|nr:hypothetical protein EGR_00668 [Echinococcus granulosus]EUB64718.1 hypothetical protein EGR_00668 [Echinococcus granulosus]
MPQYYEFSVPYVGCGGHLSQPFVLLLRQLRSSAAHATVVPAVHIWQTVAKVFAVVLRAAVRKRGLKNTNHLKKRTFVCSFIAAYLPVWVIINCFDMRRATNSPPFAHLCLFQWKLNAFDLTTNRSSTFLLLSVVRLWKGEYFSEGVDVEISSTQVTFEHYIECVHEAEGMWKAKRKQGVIRLKFGWCRGRKVTDVHVMWFLQKIK